MATAAQLRTVQLVSAMSVALRFKALTAALPAKRTSHQVSVLASELGPKLIPRQLPAAPLDAPPPLVSPAAPLHVVRERLAAHQLHREVREDRVADALRAGVVHLSDTGMLEARQHLRLTLESPQQRRGRSLGAEHLQRDGSPGLRLLGLVHDAHAAAAEFAHDAERAELLGNR